VANPDRTLKGKPFAGFEPAATATSPDLATIIGLLAGFLFVIAAIAIGGNFETFVDTRSALIVLGGTFAITAVSFSPAEVVNAQRAVVKALLRRPINIEATATRMINLIGVTRRNGLPAMENQLKGSVRHPFALNALSMAADGMESDELERILVQEVRTTAGRHAASASLFRRAAEVAPAMGLIGTLVGLVQMLNHLNEPQSIGPAMAIALLTTLYGAVLGNMVFAPLASKLERNSREESLLLSIYAATAVAIAKQEHPRRLEQIINSMLPPTQRIQYFK